MACTVHALLLTKIFYHFINSLLKLTLFSAACTTPHICYIGISSKTKNYNSNPQLLFIYFYLLLFSTSVEGL